MGTSRYSLDSTISNVSTVSTTAQPIQGGTSVSAGRTISVGRVKDIIFDQGHPKWKENGEFEAVGTIYYASISDNNEESIARPLFPNIKHYPLVNEIVYLIALPNPNTQLVNTKEGSKVSQLTTYYFPPINVWNSIHHNALPLEEQIGTRQTKNDYKASEGGLVRQVDDGSTDIPLNSPTGIDATFTESIDIQSLQPFPGDYINEGRWGNSIRFSSTVSGSYVNSGWSDYGSNGNPITIIRNGAAPTDTPGWEYTIEDINADLSSIWLTSDQKVNLNPSSTNGYVSYVNTTPPSSSNAYTSNQIIINSGRLFFNSKDDHIMLSSYKSINLNALESVNIEASKEAVISTKAIYLGGVDTSQPVVKGQDLVDTLNDILDDLSSLTKSLRDQQIAQFGPLVGTNIVAAAINSKIEGYKANLATSLSSITKTV